MRKFTNLFLLLFLFVGVLSLADELLRSLAGTALFGPLRQSVTASVLLSALLLLVLSGFDRRLPKGILFPLIAFSCWSGVDFWPLPQRGDAPGIHLSAAAGQLLLGLAVLAWLRCRNGGSLLLTPATFSGPWFRLRHTLICAAVALPLLPLLLAFLTLASASRYLERETAGFMRLTPAGIYMTERVYRQGTKTVRLAAMMHLGQAEYYQELAATVPPGRTIILLEGVSDNDHLLTDRFAYGNIGAALGLVSQEALVFAGRMVALDALAQPGDGEDPAPEAHMLRADVDINRFDPRTVAFLNVLGSTWLNPQGAWSGLRAYNAWAAEHMTATLMRTLMADILSLRNRELLRNLRLTSDHYDSILIPWGALHMPGIETALLAQGFRLEAQHQRLSFDFSRLPYLRLLNGDHREAGEESGI